MNEGDIGLAGVSEEVRCYYGNSLSSASKPCKSKIIRPPQVRVIYQIRGPVYHCRGDRLNLISGGDANLHVEVISAGGARCRAGHVEIDRSLARNGCCE